MIDRLGLAEAVIVLGNVPFEQLPDVYRAADVVVSIPSSDSSPRSVWEALACGRPVVVSDLPWARDELAPGGQALLVPLDADAVAEAILRVLDDGDLATSLGAAGRKLAVEELDPVRARPGSTRSTGRSWRRDDERAPATPRCGRGAVGRRSGRAADRRRGPEHRPRADDRPVGKRPLRAAG